MIKIFIYFFFRKTEDSGHSECHHELSPLQEGEDGVDAGETGQICMFHLIHNNTNNPLHLYRNNLWCTVLIFDVTDGHKVEQNGDVTKQMYGFQVVFDIVEVLIWKVWLSLFCLFQICRVSIRDGQHEKYVTILCGNYGSNSNDRK